ncbi:hypothetical protein EUGRSUZ_H02394 [Eucalyptus grandis]|uniref:Uncharacterized protein n=2 Tax=Eucalyptus grandis TaxID=71139 RepID=A0ACC3JQV1_EUCGR|nr:hypothetical protein EUGRSUZ_H02394 [Eucalyptus grandis]
MSQQPLSTKLALLLLPAPEQGMFSYFLLLDLYVPYHTNLSFDSIRYYEGFITESVICFQLSCQFRVLFW